MQNFETLKQQYADNIQSDERMNIIDEILIQYIKETNILPQKERKIAFFLGGGSNTGKSTFRDDLMQVLNNILIIDTDELKKEIPEYLELVKINSKIAASIVHEESSLMASELLKKAIEKEISTLFDATLKNTNKYINFINLLRQAGFYITLIIVDVPVEIALERNRIRYEEAVTTGNYPRLVPDEMVIKSHSMIAKSFIIIKDLIDEWSIIDTQNGKEIIAYGKKGTEEVINNTIKYNEFLKK